MIHTTEPTVTMTLKDFKILESAADTLEKMLHNPERQLIVGRTFNDVYYIPINDEFGMDAAKRIKESQDDYEKLRVKFRELESKMPKK